MKIEELNLEVDNSRLLTNLELYKILKDVVQTKYTLTQSIELIEILILINKSKDNYESKRENLINSLKEILIKGNKLEKTYELIDNSIFEIKHLQMFKIALNLVRFKDFILTQSKLISQSYRTSDDIHILDFQYDYNSLYVPYTIRVAGALLIKVLFSNIDNDNSAIYQSIQKDLSKIKNIDADVILQIIYSESASQSIRSSAGGGYEDRFEKLLKINKIDYHTKCHDSKVSAVEYDFKILKNQKSIGVSVKRTLRERYKQNHDDVSTLDVDAMFLITLGIDLNKDKIEYITQKELYYIFVASDIYSKKEFMQNSNKVYPISELSNDLISKLL